MSENEGPSTSNADVKPVPENEEEDDEQGVTMLDVLEEEQDLEQDANAVLGGSDDQNCTYSKGYVGRQALYTCTTCIPATGENAVCAGICLACSYNCHEGHELIELYTKRNFKCDCGNSKFGDNICSLEPTKDDVNAGNSYNQNFRGVYCICARPYPDPDDTVEDEMIQCIVCEDWFHGRHLDLPVQAPITSHNFSEMICGGCMEKNNFLWHYAEEFAVSYEAADVSVDVDETSVAKTEVKNGSVEPKPETTDEKKDQGAIGNNENIKAETDEAKDGGEETKDDANIGNEEKKEIPAIAKKRAECFLKNRAELPTKKAATFWPSGWRKNLCSCQQCTDLYTGRDLMFLLNEEDMVQAYEEAGKEKSVASGTQYEQGMRALSSLDRVSQVEAIQEYNQMKVELKEFLAGFAATKRVVREEDIKDFFADLQARKKRRGEGGVPHFCH